MKESETAKIFESLPLPQPSSASSCSFSALPLAADSAHKLAKDEGGCPCLLVATGPAAKTQTRVPLVLENLAVLFDLRCQVSSPNMPTQSGTFTVLKCVAADLVVRAYFLSLLKGIPARKTPACRPLSRPAWRQAATSLDSSHGLLFVVTSNRIGLPLLLNLKSSVKLDGNDQLLGALAAAISKLCPYDLMADDIMADEMITETPMTSATITDVVFIKCGAD